MRDEKRIDIICELLKKLWHKFPTQRLGQLLENDVFFRGVRGDGTSFMLYIQRDEKTEQILKKKIKRLEELDKEIDK